MTEYKKYQLLKDIVLPGRIIPEGAIYEEYHTGRSYVNNREPYKPHFISPATIRQYPDWFKGIPPQPSSIDRIEVKSIPNKQDEIRIAELEKELDVTESLLNERQRILDAIPECEAHGKCVPHALDWVEMKKSKIYSQSEVDTIREETWKAARETTFSFKGEQDFPNPKIKYPTLQDYLNSLSKETKPKEEDKPVLFITEDGVEIRNGDHAFYVQDDNNWMVVSHSGITEKRPYPYFHTSESANKWVLENKPCLSLNEVKELANNNGAKVLCIPDEKISNYAKQKLNTTINK